MYVLSLFAGSMILWREQENSLGTEKRSLCQIKNKELSHLARDKTREVPTKRKIHTNNMYEAMMRHFFNIDHHSHAENTDKHELSRVGSFILGEPMGQGSFGKVCVHMSRQMPIPRVIYSLTCFPFLYEYR